MAPERSLCTSRVGINVADVNKNLAEKTSRQSVYGAYGLSSRGKRLLFILLSGVQTEKHTGT